MTRSDCDWNARRDRKIFDDNVLEAITALREQDDQTASEVLRDVSERIVDLPDPSEAAQVTALRGPGAQRRRRASPSLTEGRLLLITASAPITPRETHGMIVAALLERDAFELVLFATIVAEWRRRCR